MTNAPKQPTAGLGIICKTPRSGFSKTRMIPLLGADSAAELAGCFLSDVAGSIEAVPASIGRRGYAVYAPEGTEPILRTFIPESFGLICQRDATLGVVLLGAARHLLEAGHDCAILVNGDSPTLPPALLEQTVAALRRPGDRVVLGPATDGGYYLIGLKVAHARLFADIPWSTPAVLTKSIERAREIDLEVVTLSLWYDVDDAQTLAQVFDELSGHPLPFDTQGVPSGRATATRRFVAHHPDLVAKIKQTLG